MRFFGAYGAKGLVDLASFAKVEQSSVTAPLEQRATRFAGSIVHASCGKEPPVRFAFGHP